MANGNVHTEYSDEIYIHPFDKEKWDKEIAVIKEEGNSMANNLRSEGRRLLVRVLAPNEPRAGDTIAAVVLPLDWKIATRLRMLESASDILTNARRTGDASRAPFALVLSNLIEGNGLYEHSVGEFFELYGKFIQKYQLKTGKMELSKMRTLLGGDRENLKNFVERGHAHAYPLPYAIRQIIAHPLGSSNNFDRPELEVAIRLLRMWVESQE